MTTENADQAEWYYEAAGSPVGPISVGEFAAKRSTSGITLDTKVWTAGMDEWEPLRNVLTAPGAGTAIISNITATATATIAQCDECSRQTPKDELLAYGHLQICTSCKDTFVDKLKLGVRVGGGPWRDRKAILFNEGAELPRRCIKCNAPAEHPITKNLSHISHWMLLLILLGFPGIVLYVLIGLIIRKRAKVTAYLCTSHRKQRKAFLTINWSVAAALVLGIVIAGNSLMGDEFAILIGFSVLGFLICAIAGIRLQLFRVQRIKDGTVRATGPSRKFLDSLQEWRNS
ncbi:MAG: DUF4339 domain-containing protein [Verrucomicrobia bacterium]|nr:DUF4339 domain-containing protein [Verrucomicrobiota bacterium]